MLNSNNNGGAAAMEKFIFSIYNDNPFQKKKIEKNFALKPEMKAELIWFFDLYAPFITQAGLTPEDLALGYGKMVAEMCESRLSFMRSGHYPIETQESALTNVYSDQKRMVRYMLALAVSQFLWIHHYRLLEFYRTSIHSLGNVFRTLEVGSGHGLFLLELLNSHTELKHAEVVDISAGSLALTQEVVRHINPSFLNRIQFKECDVLTYQADAGKFDFIVMGEVLEHVNDPQAILKSLHRMLDDNGRVFISTCANCPAVDHVYHFKSVDDIRKILTNADFIIEHECVAASEEASPERIEKLKLDVSYAAILKKS